MARVKAVNICINISADLSHLELLQYDAIHHKFLQTDSAEFMFDPATRELLEDTDHLKTVIKRLYDRNKLSYKTPLTVVLPSFFTREYSVPESVIGDDLKAVLVSEAERFYVFKKIDPEVGYAAIKNGLVLYTAYPKVPLEFVKQAFADLKLPLLSIDCSYTATIRGLIAMGVVQAEVTDNLKWGVLVISDFNVFFCILEGDVIEKTLESPLPLQNAEEDNLLNEIKSDFKSFFGYEILTRMVVVNNSYKIFSPTLIDQLAFEGTIDVFDQNDRTLASRGAQEAPFPCSLEAVGGALSRVTTRIPTLNLADEAMLDAYIDDDRQTMIAYSLIGAGAVLFALQFGVGFGLDTWTGKETEREAQLQADINAALGSLAIIPEVQQKLFVKNGQNYHYKMNNVFIKIDQALPPDAWLKEVSLKAHPDFKELGIEVKGGAVTSDPLSTYVKELNKEIEAPPLTTSITPQQLEDQRYFEYTLTNAATAPAGGAPH